MSGANLVHFIHIVWLCMSVCGCGSVYVLETFLISVYRVRGVRFSPHPEHTPGCTWTLENRPIWLRLHLHSGPSRWVSVPWIRFQQEKPGSKAPTFLCGSGGWKPRSYSLWPVDSPCAVRPWGRAPKYSTHSQGWRGKRPIFSLSITDYWGNIHGRLFHSYVAFHPHLDDPWWSIMILFLCAV